MCEMSVIGKGLLSCVKVVGETGGWVPCDDSHAVDTALEGGWSRVSIFKNI